MRLAHFLLGVGLCAVSVAGDLTPRHDVRKFIDVFMFGAATAAYQVEGAWDVDGKTENIWDHLAHQRPCEIKNCDSGDVAGNSYYLYKRDVEMLRELGVDFYRFSLSWTRILPTGFSDTINQAGVDYYNNLIDELLKYNITPVATIFHWDLPTKLQKLGGWTNPHIVDWYGDYAKTVFELFGDRVKHWITINEPYQVCYFGYGSDLLAPMMNIGGYAEYLCGKYVLLGHARAYHIYNEQFRPSQGGSIFITLSAHWYEPHSDGDRDAAFDANQFNWGQYAHPIFSKTGDYPRVMKERIAARSLVQGFSISRLPEFTPDEIEYIRGTSDYFGLNHYAASFVYRNSSVYGHYESPSFFDDLGVIVYDKKVHKKDVGSPWAFNKLLKSINEQYGNPPVFVTENGRGNSGGLIDEDRITYYRQYLSAMLDAIDDGCNVQGYTAWSLMDNFEWMNGYSYGNPPVFVTENGRGNSGGLIDEDRITYYRQYLSAMLDAIDDGCNVQGYTAWSLMDNFEWMNGYSIKFGLYELDVSTPERTRTPRKSAYVYREIIRTRSLDMHYEPDLSQPIGD